MKHLFGKDKGEEHNFWMSYTDLMSGFLIVFIIAALVFYNQRNNYIDKIPEEQIDSLSVILKRYSVKQLEEAANALSRYKLDEIDSATMLMNQFSNLELESSLCISKISFFHLSFLCSFSVSGSASPKLFDQRLPQSAGCSAYFILNTGSILSILATWL